LGIKDVKGGALVNVYVKPSSRVERMTLAGEVCIETRAPPSGNKANIEVIRVLSKALCIPCASISVVRGSTSRTKVLLVRGIGAAEVEQRLKRQGGP